MLSMRMGMKKIISNEEDFACLGLGRGLGRLVLGRLVLVLGLNCLGLGLGRDH